MPPKFVKFAHALSPETKGHPLPEEDLLAELKSENPAWVHLDGTDAASADWISQRLDYLDPQAIEALLDVDTRPRASVMGTGMIIILRVMNTNRGEAPEDMVSIRMWVDAHRIVTISRNTTDVITTLHRAMKTDKAPQTAAEFLVQLIEGVTDQIAAFQTGLDDKAEALEEQVIGEKGDHLSRDVVDLRLKVIAARRFLGPQVTALSVIARARFEWMDTTFVREIEEEQLKLTRVVEDLDELRDQAMVLREELSAQLSDRLNRNMFFLSVVSAIFLPLGFLTGLFGVNVGGMPGVNDRDAFLWLCLGMFGVSAFLLLVLWRLKWIGGRANH